MAHNLENLGVDKLIQLGGIKERCSATLCCAEHGLLHPCELCELEGLTKVVCTACGQPVDQIELTTPDRPCASIALFEQAGRIASEAEAEAKAINKKTSRRAIFAFIFSFVAAITGSGNALSGRLFDISIKNIGFTSLYFATVLLVWYIGTSPLRSKDRSNLDIDSDAWFGWSYVTFALPTLFGLIAIFFFTSSIGGIFLGFFVIWIGASCIRKFGLILSTKPPWRRSGISTWFSGFGSIFMWIIILIVFVANGYCFAGILYAIQKISA